MAGAIYLIFFFNSAAYKRQATEESLADEYIDWLIDNAEELDASDNDEVEVETAGEDGVISMDWTDDVYYTRDGITYTPDYAKGYLLCVLEYPSLQIRRGVYSGTWDDIYENLDMWMVTAAHPSMVVGQTHMAIYGHNHTSQNLSFNNLKNAAIGDIFYLYSETGVYTYEVTEIFSEWRESVSSKYVDDFSISEDICYIITCGRDNFLINGESTRYKDFIVKGELVEHQSLTEYAISLLEEMQ